MMRLILQLLLWLIRHSVLIYLQLPFLFSKEVYGLNQHSTVLLYSFLELSSNNLTLEAQLKGILTKVLLHSLQNLFDVNLKLISTVQVCALLGDRVVIEKYFLQSLEIQRVCQRSGIGRELAIARRDQVLNNGVLELVSVDLVRIQL